MPHSAALSAKEPFHATARDGNRFVLLGDGREFFARMLSAIDAAADYVLVEFYLVESGRVMQDFIAAFARATRRGVRVRALFDAFGARGLTEADRARLRAAQVELVLFGAIRWRSFPRFFPAQPPQALDRRRRGRLHGRHGARGHVQSRRPARRPLAGLHGRHRRPGSRGLAPPLLRGPGSAVRGANSTCRCARRPCMNPGSAAASPSAAAWELTNSSAR